MVHAASVTGRLTQTWLCNAARGNSFEGSVSFYNEKPAASPPVVLAVPFIVAMTTTLTGAQVRGHPAFMAIQEIADSSQFHG